MGNDNEPDKQDPDIGGTKLFIGGIVAIVFVMGGMYWFAHSDAFHLATNSAAASASFPADEAWQSAAARR